MAETASAAAPAPVMDVVAPPVEKKVETPTEADPVDQLAAADKKSRQALDHDKTDRPAKQKQPTKQAETTHHSGIGLAITATVIIVLALAMLATYAYIQTNK